MLDAITFNQQTNKKKLLSCLTQIHTAYIYLFIRVIIDFDLFLILHAMNAPDNLY